MKYLTWPGRIRVTGAALGGVALVLGGIVAGIFANMAFVDLTTWPYHVVDRRLVGENGTSKEVLTRFHRGGELNMQRLIEYHELECERWYARRAVSETKDSLGAVTVTRFPEIHDPQLPADLSGRWQKWTAALPATFPCGKAYLVETVTASCNAFHRNIRYLHKPDIITPFEVVGCDRPPG